MHKSRLVIPQARECPSVVLGHLREVLPTAELVHMGDDKWVLGNVVPTNIRERIGRMKLHRAGRAIIAGRNDAERMRRLARWRYIGWEGLLLTQGFATITVFQQNDPDSRMVEFLREREYGWARDIDALLAQSAMKERADELGVEQDAGVSAYFAEEKLREAWKAVRIKQGRRKSVLYNKTLRSA